MARPQLPTVTEQSDWLCPDITPYWRLSKIRDRDRVLLKAKTGSTQYQFSSVEGYALRHFVGKYTIAEIQTRCQKEFTVIDAQLVAQLLQKLVALNILALEGETENATPQNRAVARFKPGVQWIHNPDGYWILRNCEDVTFLQVSDRDRAIIEDMTRYESDRVCQQNNASPMEVRRLLQLLAATGMLEGTAPQKPKRGKFHPMQLLFFKLSLFNPDPWLSDRIDGLRWMWTKGFAWVLFFFLSLSAIVGVSKQAEILYIGQELWKNNASDLMLPFVLLVALVVSIHELGHAFTLKHYGGIVPDMGFLFMCLFPAAYTNTTDSYCLSRFQRILVVGAGVFTQLVIAAIALWLWQFSIKGNWLYISSYLLMMAALLTVALNLNPLAKFDGYHLAVAITKINNLRSRSFAFYGNLLRGKPIRETPRDARILALYAPFSLAYIWFVFGFLFARLGDWIMTQIPFTALVLLVIWAIYFYWPESQSASKPS